MKLIKFVLALLLLPFLVAEGWALVDMVALWWPKEGWHATWFISAAGGFLAWAIVFFSLPRPFQIYVYGHELTHALAAWIAGGRVFSFRTGTSGGEVKTDKINWWIALSPYFVPLYALIWSGLWWSVDFYYPLAHWRWVFFFGLGMAWGFHVLFTFHMIGVGQSDLQNQGTFFSLVVIFLTNLLVMMVFLIMVAKPITVRACGRALIHRTNSAYVYTWQQGVRSCRWAVRECRMFIRHNLR